MSNYVKATNFTAKDSLPSGNSGKIIKGTEIDAEFTAIASAISSKADSNSPTLTGTPLAPTASSGTNTTQIATTAFVTTAVTASFPSGGIIIWSGSVAAIPSGWYLCDGTNSTPDLRDRFVVGAGTTYAVGNTGGSKDATAISHTHTFSATSGSGGTDGSFYVAAGAGRSEGGASGGFSITNTTAQSFDRTTGSYPTTVGSYNYTAAHTHTISGTTGSTGSSGTNANLPPYYALCYIMKA